MCARLRKGLSSARAPERDALLKAESLARRLALQSEVLCKLDADRIGITDCTDVTIGGSWIRWYRKQGKLNVRISVRLLPLGTIRSYSWRVPVPYNLPNSKVVREAWGLQIGDS